jgi:hypothetical protein
LWISRAEASEWRRLVRGKSVLHCYAEDLDHGSRILTIVEASIPGIADDLQLSTIGNVIIVIAPTEREFQRLTGGQIPEWGVGAADPSQSVVFLKSPRVARPEINIRQVLIHELSHVLLGMAVGSNPVDRWFDEGFAQYASGETGIRGGIVLARSLFTGHFLWLDEIDEVLTFRRDKANLAYQEARTAIYYLVDKYGDEVIAGIVRALKDGNEMDGALRAVIGMGFQDFQTDWYLAMKQKYRWYILMDFPLVFSLVIVILFLTAFIVTRRRIRKTKRIWEEEEKYGFETREEHTASC